MRRRTWTLVAGLVALGAFVVAGSAAAATRTWDGGGETANWSDAANWSDDVPPGPGDIAILDGTSAKDATIDTGFSLQGLRIDAAYTGTLTQAAGAELAVGNGLSGSIYEQGGGTFRGGTAPITFRFTTFSLTGGAFDLGTSNATFASCDLNLTGGRFIASSGTTRLAGSYRRSDPATFEHNNGSVVVTGSSSLDINGAGPGTELLNNLTVDNPDSFNNSIGGADTVRVVGSLDLIDGDMNGGTLEAQGPVTIASTFGFGSGAGSTTLLITGPARTITLPTGMGPFLNLVLDAPDTTLNTSGPGPITLKRVALVQGTIDSGAAVFAIGTGISGVEYTQSGGTFQAGGGPLTLPFVTFTLTGGVFDLAASNATFASCNLTLTGGRFIASSGTTRLAGSYRRSDPATFEHNNGSVVVTGSSSLDINGAGPGTELLNNLTVDNPDSFNNSIGAIDTVRVVGSLNLIDGDMNGGTLEAQGPVTIASTFGFSSGAGSTTLLITGPARTITLPTGMGPFLNLVLDAADTTVDTSGPGPITLKRVALVQGTIDSGAAAFAIGTGISGVEYAQSGGTFQAGGGPLTLPFVTFTLTGGVFDLAASNATFASCDLNLTGGRFIASSGATRLAGSYRRSDPATFEHNNGSVIVIGSFSWEINGPGPGTETLNNLTVNNPDSFSISIGGADTVRVLRELSLVNGSVSFGRLRAEGPVSVEATFDGGTTAFTFGGDADQGYVNGGGPNLTGIWTVDKSGGTVTLASDLNLGNGTAAFDLASGTITTGGRIVDIGTRPVTRTSGHVIGNLKRTLTTTGTKSFDVGTANGYSPVSLNVTTLTENPSSLTVGALQGPHPLLAPPTSLGRYWSLAEAGALRATLNFNYLQADVSGSEADYKVARVAGGEVTFLDPPTATVDVVNNRATVPNVTEFSDWTLGERPVPPPPLLITPAAAIVAAAGTQPFVATGGVPPYVFSLPVDNSGANIDAATGLYTAGTLASVTDTVSVTDSLGAEVNATVDVVAGAPHHLVFLVQPTNVVAGAAMAPAVTVAVQDQFGNLAAFTSPISIALASNPGGATLTGTLNPTPVNGIAAFGDLRLDRAEAGYSFVATAGPLAPATSGSFDVAPDAPARLALAVQPSSVAVSQPITPPVEVAVQDRFGNPTTATNAITLVLASNPSGGQLAGTVTRDAVDGIASFGDLTIDRPGAGYALRATSGALTEALSASFDVLAQDLVVTNTDDAGPGSLRRAIEDANALPGRETVRFDIPGDGPHTIALLTLLPKITSPIVIDGSTQPGYAGSPLVEIDGVNVEERRSTGRDGLDIAGEESVIKALGITRFTGSDSDGIVLRSSGNRVQGCYLGVGVDGLTGRGNQTGLRVVGNNNLIGGAEVIEGNVVSGNLGDGLFFLGGRFNLVIGNFVGTSAAGSAAVPNGGNGIVMSRDTAVGDSSPGSGNVIAFNGGAGVSTIFAVSQTRVRGNSIHSNQALGIDIDGDGVTPNDSGDGLPQNFPVLNAVLGTPGGITIQGTLDSKPSAAFTLDFYASSSCDPSGQGEGETPLGSTTVTTDGAGQADFMVTLPAPLGAGTVVTATATDGQQNTSEFSPCQLLGDATFVVTTTSDGGPGSLREAILDASAATRGAIRFDIAGTGPFSIAPDAPLPTIFGSVVVDGTTQPGYAVTPLVAIDASRMTGGCEAGLRVGGSNTTIKGLTIGGCRSLAAPFSAPGILLEGAGGHSIQACHVVGNQVGILVASSDNRIGGSIPFERNVISDNLNAGIALDGSRNVVTGNFIGTDASGRDIGGVQQRGVSVLGSAGTGNSVGGTQSSAGNVIAFNFVSGVQVSGGNVAVRGNSIFTNFNGLGIDLAGDFVTPNDTGDGDLGPNGLQNFPILTSVSGTGPTIIQGRLVSKPSTTFALDFYANATCHPRGHGEGQTRLGSGTVTTDAAGIVGFAAPVPSLTSVAFVTATATDPEGNTSEFSPCRLFATVHTVVNPLSDGPGTLRRALLDANSSPGPDLIRFQINGGGPFTIALLNPPSIDGSVMIDGTSQPGYAGTPLIELDGSSNPGNRCLALSGSNSTIKGLAINRCRGAGIELRGNGGHAVRGCRIGTDRGGTLDRGNGIGVWVNSSNNVIGGIPPADHNVISGNDSYGVVITGPATQNVLQGNRIGGEAVPNGVGVAISASGNTVGGLAGNEIAHNTGDGVVVFAGTGNRLRGNRIHSNLFLQVDLGSDGMTANDAGDADSGANDLQNFPALTSALSDGQRTIVEGTLNSRPASAYVLDFYRNTSCDTYGNGHGGTLLGSSTVILDTSGIGAFAAEFPQGTAGQFLTTMATDASGNSSEFSRCKAVGGQGRVRGTVSRAGGGFLKGVEVRLSGTRHESVVTTTAGTFEFGSLPPGDYVVTPVRPNFTFQPPSRSFTHLETSVQADFVAIEHFRISGRVTSLFDDAVYPLGGASVTLSGAVSRTVLTDSSGLYAFDDVPQTGSFTVVATKPGFLFNPGAVDIAGPLDRDQVADFQGGLVSPLPGRIAVTGTGKRIHVMNADGSGQVPVSAPVGRLDGDFDPRFSHDGRQIAFRRVRVSALGGQPQLLNLGEIHVMNTDGSDLRRVTDNSEAEFTDAGPAWSPDGRRIAFARASAGAPGTDEDLIVVNANGSDAARILSGVPSRLRAVGAPDWSPDGRRIAFSMSFDGSNGRQIFLVDPDGGNLTALTTGIAGSLSPAWSPDGARIAFLRQVGTGANPFSVVVIAADGQGARVVATGALGDRLAWSPDGTRLAYLRRAAAPVVANELVVVNADGTGPLVVASGPIAGPTWAATVRTDTPSGAEVEVREGAAAVTFSSVTAAGLTTITPIPAPAAGTAPNGFLLGGIAFEIGTSAAFTPPITVCFTVAPTTRTQFDAFAILHAEGGVFVDRTTSRDFASSTVCGTVDSLSPFALAESIAPGGPIITALVSDGEPKPLGGVAISLAGTETRSGATGLDGLSTFANLEEGGNYSVEPEALGFLFDEPLRDIVDLHGDQAVSFRATAASFRISGRVSSAPGDPAGRGLSGISVTLEGSLLRQATTDAFGRYSFEDVPAGGTYTVTPALPGLTFTPGQELLVDLTGDETGVDFAPGAPPAPMTVQPILECVADNGDGRFTAHFGYRNDGAAVTIAVGPDNVLKPARPDPGQPTAFQPGRVENAFEVDFRGRGVVWVLRGPDGRRHTAVALRDGPACP